AIVVFGEAFGRMHAGLDALGQRDLVLAREERHTTDLLEVHAHVVGRERPAAVVVAPRVAAWASTTFGLGLVAGACCWLGPGSAVAGAHTIGGAVVVVAVVDAVVVGVVGQGRIDFEELDALGGEQITHLCDHVGGRIDVLHDLHDLGQRQRAFGPTVLQQRAQIFGING